MGQQEQQEKKGGCEYPDCPSRWLNNELITELKVIQTNQTDQRKVQEKMLDQQIISAGIQADIAHAKEDLRKVDVRITDAFRELAKKVDEGALPPPTELITKKDVAKLIAYTGGLVALIFAVLEVLIRSR